MAPLFAFVLILLILPHAAVSNKFDSDTGVDCADKASRGLCIMTNETYHECPITCARQMRPKSATFGGFDSFESRLYEFRWRDYMGKIVNFEEFEGEILAVACVPMLPGLAQFHYDLLSHVLEVYKYGVNVIIIPIKGELGVAIEPKEGSRVRILEGLQNDDTHPVLMYLSKFIQQGKFDWRKHNTFLVGSKGHHITLHVSPDMKTYRKFLDSELHEMEDEDL